MFQDGNGTIENEELRGFLKDLLELVKKVRRKQTSFFSSMTVAFSDSHPTLYVVSPYSIERLQTIMIVMRSVSCRQWHNITKLFEVTIEEYLCNLLPKFEDLALV